MTETTDLVIRAYRGCDMESELSEMQLHIIYVRYNVQLVPTPTYVYVRRRKLVI